MNKNLLINVHDVYRTRIMQRTSWKNVLVAVRENALPNIKYFMHILYSGTCPGGFSTDQPAHLRRQINGFVIRLI